VTELMEVERARYLDVLDRLGIDKVDVEQLLDASRRVDDLRFAGRLPPAEGTGVGVR
jgi:hypothetical protein